MYELEKGKEIPAEEMRGRNEKYPFHKMEIGDSFVAEFANKNSLATIVSRINKTLDKKFKVKRVIENGSELVRVWRIK